MAILRFPAAAAISAALLLASQGPVAAAPPAPRTLVIGVDHLDLANQQPD
jgi:hypothetical protein